MIQLIFILVCIFFSFLQSRYIFGGDSAEYSTIARTWASAHPPGYPLYSFLINIINHIIPFGTTPWRVALLSSIPTILTAFLFYRIFLLLKVDRRIALLVSVFYLFLFPVWQYALIPEVFGLQTLLWSLITYLLLTYILKKNNKLLLLVSFLFGLSIGHHHIFILFIPGWFTLLKGKIKKIYENKKLFIKMIQLAIVGASVYLYAIITSFNTTILNWEDAKTIQGFLRLITRSAYGSFKAYSSSGGNVVNQLSDVFSGLVFILIDFKPLGILLICLGMYASRTYLKQFSHFLLISLIVHFMFLFYTNFSLTSSVSSGMYERFLIPLYGILILYLGLGVDYLYKNCYLRVVNIMKNTSLKKSMITAYFIVISIYIFSITIQNFKSIYYIAQTNVFDQFGKDIVNTVPKGGILATQGDTSTFVSYYYLFGLQERKDVVPFLFGIANKSYIEMIKKRYPSLKISGFLNNDKSIASFIENNNSNGIYTDHEMGIGSWRVYGLLWKYYSDDLSASSDSAQLLAKNKIFWEKVYLIPVLSKEEKNIFHLNSVNEYYINAYINYSKLLVSLGKNEDAEVVLKKIAEIYKKGDLQSEATYMNILVLNSKCAQASQVAHRIDLVKTTKANPGFAKSVVAYLQKCDSSNKNLPYYTKMFIENQKKTKTNLDSF